MVNPNREFDKTHLSIEQAEERVIFHRDFFAHAFRWSHVIKHLYKQHNYKSALILDVACGKEMPLARALYSNKMSGASYHGVDLNKLALPDMLTKAVDNGKLHVTYNGETNVCEMTQADIPFRPNIICNFESFEHMHPKHARKSLEVMHSMLTEDGIMFFSTPCWNGSAAANHINETTYEAMGFILQDVGFAIEDHFGTFASITDYKDAVEDDGLGRFFNRMREYYDTNLLSNFMAPAYPQYSRNVLWVLRKHGIDCKTFHEPTAKWSQHADYKEMVHE